MYSVRMRGCQVDGNIVVYDVKLNLTLYKLVTDIINTHLYSSMTAGKLVGVRKLNKVLRLNIIILLMG